MATKIENIITAENAVNTMRKTIASYHALYKADGTIEASKLTELETMLADIKLIKAKLALTKKALEAKESESKVVGTYEDLELLLDCNPEDLYITFTFAIQLWCANVEDVLRDFQADLVKDSGDETTGVLPGLFWLAIDKVFETLLEKYNEFVAIGFDLFKDIREVIYNANISDGFGKLSLLVNTWEQYVDALKYDQEKHRKMFDKLPSSYDEKLEIIKKIPIDGSGVLPSLSEIKESLLIAWIDSAADGNDVPDTEAGYVYLEIYVEKARNSDALYAYLDKGHLDDLTYPENTLEIARNVWSNVGLGYIPLRKKLYIQAHTGAEFEYVDLTPEQTGVALENHPEDSYAVNLLLRAVTLKHENFTID